jgi:hypothetical protein
MAVLSLSNIHPSEPARSLTPGPCIIKDDYAGAGSTASSRFFVGNYRSEGGGTSVLVLHSTSQIS